MVHTSTFSNANSVLASLVDSCRVALIHVLTGALGSWRVSLYTRLRTMAETETRHALTGGHNK